MKLYRRVLLLFAVLVGLGSWAVAEGAPRAEKAAAVIDLDAGGRPSPVRSTAKRDPMVQRVAHHMQQPQEAEPVWTHGALVEGDVPSEGGPLPGEYFEEYSEPYGTAVDLDAPAPTASSGEWLRNGYWYTQQSAVYMSRSVSVKNSPILATDFSSSNIDHYRTFLSIPLDMGYQPGARSTVGRYLGRDPKNRDHSVEFTYLGMAQFHTSGSLEAVVPGGILSNFLDPAANVPAFNRSDSQNFFYTSNFASFELNYRIDRRLNRDKLVYSRDSTWVRQIRPTLLPSLFAGIRYVSVDEEFNWFANASSFVPASTGSYHVNTHNNLVGAQIGSDWFYEAGEWRLGMRGKSGAFVNFADQTSTVRILDSNGTPLEPNRNEHAEQDILNFVGELNFIGNYQFRPNCGLRFSYDLMFVTNLALAQNQLTFTVSDPPQISVGHSLFFQGVSLGFEFTR